MKEMEKQGLSPVDPSSYSRPDQIIVTHIYLNLTVDFNKKVLHGHVILTAKKVSLLFKELILDTLQLNICSVTNNKNKEKLNFTLDNPFKEFGSKLTIKLPETDLDELEIRIDYSTSPEASGLQWISPEATAGKRHPFLFSQFQAVHARSVVPCQDTPYVKQTYKAMITTPAALTSLMSAIRDKTDLIGDVKETHFVQRIPVPSYLIAIVVGDLTSSKIGPRCQVWAEEELIEECAYEFANTEHQLITAEKLCGDYEWGIYDLLVLPPSFPFGGMENPCLTFITPTLLAGDRSLANVVAHEIAHSWTGNLVTNKTFEHFWLNEGFTVFIERKIKGRLENCQAQDFDAYTAILELKETVKKLGPDNPLTKLVVDLKGVHPDDAFSSIPYEKGHTFLRHLESVVGGPSVFEQFLRCYFSTFKFKSIETDDFKQFFNDYFKDNEGAKTIDWDTWLYSPGMPPVIPQYNTVLADSCDNILNTFLAWNSSSSLPLSEEDAKKLSTNQIIYFLDKLLDSKPQDIVKLKSLQTLFSFDNVKNSEIKFRWLRICIKARWEEKAPAVLDWVNVVGRMKFARPLYRDMFQWDIMRQKTIENYKVNKKNMMHVTAHMIGKELELLHET